MNWKTVFLIFLYITTSSAQSAWTSIHESAVSQLNESDRRAFDETMRSCTEANNRKFYEIKLTTQEASVLYGTFGDINYAFNKITTSGIVEGTQVFRHTKGIGMYLYELLNSYGFRLAMKKCFNGNESREYLYVANLLLFDAEAKGFVLYSSVKSLGFLMSRFWGKALLTAFMVAPISGRDPRPEDLSLVQQLEMQLKIIQDQVEKITKNK